MSGNRPPIWEYLENRGMLVTIDLSDEEIMRRERRCGGECVCETCKKTYREHPYITNVVDWEDRPFLHLLCDGTVAKL